MDAREKLRIYLEQRRELGESEMLLDSMSVDEALKAIGAFGKSGAAPSVSPREQAGNPTGDWRSVLAHSGNAPQRQSTPADAPPVPAPQAGITIAGEPEELFDSDIMKLSSLTTIAKAVEACTRCPLYKTANHGVPGEGAAKARLVCVGEAPGANEDETGRPFVGQAGALVAPL